MGGRAGAKGARAHMGVKAALQKNIEKTNEVLSGIKGNRFRAGREAEDWGRGGTL